MASELRPKEPVPLYYQLELLLREQIETGRLKPGGPLPGEQDLATQFQVSRITVRRALERLEEDGLILRRRGARTTIARQVPHRPRNSRDQSDFRGFEDEMQRLGLQPHARLLESSTGAPPPWIASLLQIPEGEAVVRIRRLGFARGIPLWVESRYFPSTIGRALLGTDFAGQSVLRLLESSLGLKVGRVEAQLEAEAATPRQAQLLHVEPGAPLLLHQSVTFDVDLHPIQVFRSHLRGDCYRFVMNALPRSDRAGLDLVGGGYLVGGGALDRAGDPSEEGDTDGLSRQETASTRAGAPPATQRRERS